MIRIKTDWEIEYIRAAGKIAAQVLQVLMEEAKVGIKTIELDRIGEKLIRELGAKPAFKGYRNYPAATCISVNSQVVHAIPGDYRLKEGDIVGIDLGTFYKGYYADIAATVGVGEISDLAKRLISTTKRALDLAISKMKENVKLNEISKQIQMTAEEEGFSVVRDLVGHGVGVQLHEEPQIYNYAQADDGPTLKAGMVLAPEPMITAGGYKVKTLPDGWTVVTVDGNISAHFEHTVAITKNGAEILTKFE